MDLNPNLTSHCGKKYAAQFMGETTCLSPLATVFRCGWEMRNVHTLFDYLVSSAVNDRKSAKVLANWNVVSGISGEIGGGIPPNVDDITTEREKANTFAELLFSTHTNLSREIKRILASNILRFYEDFVDLIKAESSECFEEPEKHYFVAMILSKLQDAQVTAETFLQWQIDIKRGFCRNNFYYLRIQTIEKLDPINGTTKLLIQNF